MKTIYLKIKMLLFLFGTLVTISGVFSCKKTNSAPQLTVSNITDTIPAEGGSVSMTFNSSASWSIDTTGIGWLQLSQISGNSGDASIQLTASPNTSGISHTVLLQLNAANGQTRRITVVQAPVIYPSYNTSPKAPDATGMSSTAVQLAAKMKFGWNFFNSLESPGDDGTGWGQPVITQALVDFCESIGINAIRIPVNYDYSHLINRTTEQIDPAWLAVVKQKVQYCINDNMYVIINIHYDNGWLNCKATGANQDTVRAKQKALWEQIATTFRDFDEHLMFASSNEPDAPDAASTVALMSYHQEFINAVRSTGGKNAYRTLVVQAPETSIDLANQFLNPGNVYKVTSLPSDPSQNRMMLEFHDYGPPNFALLSSDASWGSEWYFWGANYHSSNPLFANRNSTAPTEEHYYDSIYHTMKINFYDKGIPLIMGEFDAINHSGRLAGYPQDSILSLNSRAHMFKYKTQTALANGIVPFVWAGGFFDRATLTITDQQALDSLRAGADL